MWKAQSAESEIDYNAALPAERPKLGDDVAACIGNTDPTYWTLFANMKIEVIDKNIRLRLFSTSSTDSYTSTHHQDHLAPTMTTFFTSGGALITL